MPLVSMYQGLVTLPAVSQYDELDAVLARQISSNAVAQCDASLAHRVEIVSRGIPASGWGTGGWWPDMASSKRAALTPFVCLNVPVRLQADGSPPRLRVRIGAKSDGASTIGFDLAFMAPSVAQWGIGSLFGATPDGVLPPEGDWIFRTTTTSSATAAWLTGATLGSTASTTTVTVPESAVESVVVPTRVASTPTTASASVEVTMVGCIVRLSPSIATTTTLAAARLCGLIIQEVAG